MASSIVKLISKKLVKPSTPTPRPLRSHKLSLLDQLMGDMAIPIAFFYPNATTTTQLSSHLEQSLSKTLAFYYPFAGRLTGNLFVDCNDMGATLIDSRIECKMSEFLKEEDKNGPGVIFPTVSPWSHVHDERTSLVVAQLSRFECGGVAVSVGMSHKVGDATTLSNFVRDWAAVARTHQSNDHHKPSPQFIGASILPPVEDPLYEPMYELVPGMNCTTRRFVFDLDKINQLKAKAAVEKPTRVEVVSALLYGCAMSAFSKSSGSFKTSSIMESPVNLRTLVGPPVTQTYVGNLISSAVATTSHERETNFPRLVSEIRRAKLQTYDEHRGIKTKELRLATLEVAEQIKAVEGKNDMDYYFASSVCRFPTYQMDFGWGRPVRMSLPAIPFKNHFILTDTNSGGIEALVNLDGQVMSIFQADPQLLAFASPLLSRIY